MIVAALTHVVFSVVVSRHGVRSITSAPKEYTWASWSPVPAGYLTAHGYRLATFLGESYKAETPAIDCAKQNVYIYADIDQRTLETARAYVEGMCGAPGALPIYHDVQTEAGTSDPLFNAEQWVAGHGNISESESASAVRAAAAALRTDAKNAIVVKGGLAELGGPLKTASSYAENMFSRGSGMSAAARDGLRYDARLRKRLARCNAFARLCVRRECEECV